MSLQLCKVLKVEIKGIFYRWKPMCNCREGKKVESTFMMAFSFFLTIIILITSHTSAFYSPSLTFLGLALYGHLIWPVLLQLAWGLKWLWDLLRVAQSPMVKPGLDTRYSMSDSHQSICFIASLLRSIFGESIRQKREEFIPYA